jgi:hypothetical protein
MSTYADAQIKKILEFNNANGVDSTRLANIIRELGEAKAIFLNEKNTYEDWEAFWFLASYVGTPYCKLQDYGPIYTIGEAGFPNHSSLDCSDLAYAFYYEYYGYGYSYDVQRKEKWGKEKIDTEKAKNMYDWTGSQAKTGEKVYSADFDGNNWSANSGSELDFSTLEFGDLVLYDLSPKGARDGAIDHVGIFVGFNDKGLPQIIDSSSGIGYIQYRNIDCCSGDSVSTNGISTIRRLGVS